jgi:hypothetical protein
MTIREIWQAFVRCGTPASDLEPGWKPDAEHARDNSGHALRSRTLELVNSDGQSRGDGVQSLLQRAWDRCKSFFACSSCGFFRRRPRDPNLPTTPPFFLLEEEQFGKEESSERPPSPQTVLEPSAPPEEDPPSPQQAAQFPSTAPREIGFEECFDLAPFLREISPEQREREQFFQAYEKWLQGFLAVRRVCGRVDVQNERNLARGRIMSLLEAGNMTQPLGPALEELLTKSDYALTMKVLRVLALEDTPAARDLPGLELQGTLDLCDPEARELLRYAKQKRMRLDGVQLQGTIELQNEVQSNSAGPAR